MRGLQSLVVSICLLAPVLGQESEGVQRFPLRVSATLEGNEVEVDRGEGIRLQVGDTILFETRDGKSYSGRVLKVLGRKAVVELVDSKVGLALGTRGHALVPKGRFVRKEEPSEGVQEALPETVKPNHDPWVRLDDAWSKGDPLLARISAVKPAERERSWGGRTYGVLDQRFDTQNDRAETFFRTGTDLWMDNPFGLGGRFQLDMEVNRFNYDLPDKGDQADSNLRVDRASYALGGNRYQPDRYEVGRFLVHGMPELGLVDGVSFSRRLDNGHSFGANLGGMPEPNADQDSGQDVQISAFYRWVADARERWTAAVAVQKSWHNGSQDRDLIIAKTDWIPVAGWRFHSNMWLDFYTSDDVDKSSGPEVTQLYMATNKDWQGQRGMRAVYSFHKFPSLLRNEFQDPATDTVDREHVHRASVGGWQSLDSKRRLTLDLGVWEDDDDSGGDLDLGIDVQDLWHENSRLGFHLFQTNGEFTEHLGLRLTYGQYIAEDHWSVLLETTRNVTDGFDPSADTFYQHRIRGTYQFHLGEAWNMSVFGEDTILEDESSFLLGLQFDRSF